MFYADGSPVEEVYQQDEDESVFEVYYKGGKGKGAGKGIGSGKGRTNPVGSDGKIMKCSDCGSEQHFRRFCTNKSKGGHSGKGSSSKPSAASSSGFFDQPISISLTDLLADANSYSTILYADGSRDSILHPQTDEPTVPTANNRLLTFFTCMLSYTWWNQTLSYHALVRLANKTKEGLLIDCGAVGNIAGSSWLSRTSALAKAAGQGTHVEQVPPVNVEGVGTGASVIQEFARVPVSLSNGMQGVFATAIVKDSELPALLGLTSLENHRAIIDIYARKLIFVGQGGYQLQLSSGSTTMGLEKVASGHLLLPCSEWEKAKAGLKLNPLEC
jgi:hypothetical protein